MNEVALKLLKRINGNGYLAYLVGGYPRDIYLGRNTLDYDICTNATPKDLKNIFGNLILPNEQYGSITLILNNTRFEITTFRKDIKYENNRKPVEIEYINNLLDDLKRRDFIMNTMCIDASGNIIDLLNAKDDINNRIINTVGDPFKKIEEDSLRILRAVRFATTLDFKLSDELKEAIKKYKYLLKNLSYYRKKEELDKIFSSANNRYGINLIIELGLDEYLELNNIKDMVPTTYLIGNWAQLNVIDKYNFNSVEKDSINQINELMEKDILDYNNLYKYGLYISTIVGEIKGIDKSFINKRYNELSIHNKSDIVINPREICMILDKKPNKFLSVIIKDLEYKIINNILENKKEELINYIRENYS